MIRIYNFDESPFCDKIRRVMNYKSIPYEICQVPVEHMLGLAENLHPIGKLPIIDHGPVRLGDSTPIAWYLEEQFPEPRLIPEDPRERGMMHFIEDQCDESLYFYELEMRILWPHNGKTWIPTLVPYDTDAYKAQYNEFIVPFCEQMLTAQGVHRKPKDMILEDVMRHTRALEGLLSPARDWLVADHITLADIAAYAFFRCIHCAEEGAEIIARYPAVVAWMDRVRQTTDAKNPAPQTLYHPEGIRDIAMAGQP